MRIIKTEKWEVEDSGEKTIIFTENKPGDTVASELYINPLDDCSIAVTGYVDKADDTGITLKCVDIAGLEKKDEVTEAGNYLYMVSSYQKVEIAVTGTATILLKWLY